MMKLSIIIPCYNAVRYVPLLLLKLKGQIGNRTDVEVIAVNDGSGDETLVALKDMANHFQSLRVLSQENAGPAMARNTGLAHAQGEYVWFVDADDDLSDNCLSLLLGEIESNPSDVICFNYRETDAQGHLLNEYRDWKYVYGKITTGLDAYAQNNIPAFLWNRVIRRDLIVKNHIRFDIIPEDEDFLLETYFYAETFRFIPDVLYYYKIMINSFSRGNVKTFVKYYNGYYAILDKYYMRLNTFKNDEFWTKMLFVCCKNLVINFNRALILKGDIHDSRHEFYKRLRKEILRYQRSGYANSGNYALGLKIVLYAPCLPDMIAYMKYKLKN